MGLPWSSATDETYAADVQRCEIRVILNQAAHVLIAAALSSDRRDAGNRGMCLVRAFPEHGLMKGDRLEPSPGTPDVLAFKDLTSFPVHAIFWRRSMETGARHRNPLFEVPGMTPERCLAGDVLHCLHLGVLQGYCKVAFHKWLDAGCWGVRETTKEEKHVVGVLCLRAELFHWYYPQTCRSSL